MRLTAEDVLAGRPLLGEVFVGGSFADGHVLWVAVVGFADIPGALGVRRCQRAVHAPSASEGLDDGGVDGVGVPLLPHPVPHRLGELLVGGFEQLVAEPVQGSGTLLLVLDGQILLEGFDLVPGAHPVVRCGGRVDGVQDPVEGAADGGVGCFLPLLVLGDVAWAGGELDVEHGPHRRREPLQQGLPDDGQQERSTVSDRQVHPHQDGEVADLRGATLLDLHAFAAGGEELGGAGVLDEVDGLLDGPVGELRLGPLGQRQSVDGGC